MSSIIKVDAIQKVDGTVPTAGDLGLNTTGSVLQVVKGLGPGGSPTSASTSYVSEGIEATITPKFNNSIILVQAMTGDSNAGGYSFYRVRNITDGVNIAHVPCGNFSGSPQWLVGVNIIGAYTVNSTASRTFRVEGQTNSSSSLRYQRYSASVYDGVSNGNGIIILTEIAG